MDTIKLMEVLNRFAARYAREKAYVLESFEIADPANESHPLNWGNTKAPHCRYRQVLNVWDDKKHGRITTRQRFGNPRIDYWGPNLNFGCCLEFSPEGVFKEGQVFGLEGPIVFHRFYHEIYSMITKIKNNEN